MGSSRVLASYEDGAPIAVIPAVWWLDATCPGSRYPPQALPREILAAPPPGPPKQATRPTNPYPRRRPNRPPDFFGRSAGTW